MIETVDRERLAQDAPPCKTRCTVCCELWSLDGTNSMSFDNRMLPHAIGIGRLNLAKPRPAKQLFPPGDSYDWLRMANN